MKKSIIIIAPFWYIPQNVGSLRVERFINWVKNDYSVILITGGSKDKKIKHDWGIEIKIRDPLGIYKDNVALTADNSVQKKSGSSLKWKTAQWLLNPDPGIVWVNRAARNKMLRQEPENVHAVISTGPPESAHVLNYKLSKLFDAKMIVDMRDGWLDDPLKEYLNKKSLRTLREKLVERKIYSAADRIFVTSPKWKDLLLKRFPGHEQKVVQLTNGYPESLENISEESPAKSGKLILIHAGKFTRSRSSQKVEYLLKPVVEYFNDAEENCEVKLIGQLSYEDLENIDQLRKLSKNDKLIISTESHVNRDELYSKFREASGFLLLSASVAAVPSKFFEYLPFRKPILTVTPANSGLWQLTKDFPQVFLADNTNTESQYDVVEDFFRACKAELDYELPEVFSNKYLANKFRDYI